MSNIQHTLIEAGDQEFLTVLIDATLMPPIDDSHPNFEKIKAIVTDPEAQYSSVDTGTLHDLFDLSATITRKFKHLSGQFKHLSERVTSSDGALFFDGDPIDGTVVETILRFLDENVADWQPLVKYIENIQTNPEEDSRTQLFDWLRHDRSIALNEYGLIVAYKGVEDGGTHPVTGDSCWQSTSAGTATVDGVTLNGKIPNYVGATVEMPRSEVAHDPQASCHTGLHVGTFSYAGTYARNGVMLAVLVNPRDVVSVPHDARGEKIRVSRYKVLGVVTEPYRGVLVASTDASAVGAPYFAVGDRVVDCDGDVGTIIVPDDVSARNVKYDEGGRSNLNPDDPQGAGDYSVFAPFTLVAPLAAVPDEPAITVGTFVEWSRSANGDRRWVGTVEHVSPDGEVTVRRPISGIGSARQAWSGRVVAKTWCATVETVRVIAEPSTAAA